MGRIVILIVALFFPLATYAEIDNAENTQSKLQQLSRLIEKLSLGLLQDRSKQSHLHEELKENEILIEKITEGLRGLQQQLAQQNNLLNDLQNKRQQYQKKLQQQQAVLSQQLRTAYMLSHYNYVDVLLSQQDPKLISRALTYYSYINRARLGFISELDATLKHLESNAAQLLVNKQQLDALLAEQRRQQDQLLTKKSKREHILGELENKIEVNDEQLKQLVSDKKALEDVLKTLQKSSSVKNFPTGRVAFGALKGKLPWPTSGKMIRPFGALIDQSGLKSTGVFIGASEGASVRVVYPGQVAFAQWLQGFGLLLIVDHGNGFMTLYGHNQALHKKVGEKVKSGDVIASVGNDKKRSGLYFEIRHEGYAENPRQWCS